MRDVATLGFSAPRSLTRSDGTRQGVGVRKRLPSQPHAHLLELQRTAGNKAVTSLMQPPLRSQTHNTPDIQRDTPHVQRIEPANQFYGHGAFMGAAPEMLKNSKWMGILKALMPTVHAEVTAPPRATYTSIPGVGNIQSGVKDPSKAGTLMPMLENNPVMAAYGMTKTQQLDKEKAGGRSDRLQKGEDGSPQKMQGIEWDVWLDPKVVHRCEVLRGMGVPDAVNPNVAELLDTMVIAHGDKTQTVMQTLSPNIGAAGENPWLQAISPLGAWAARSAGPAMNQYESVKAAPMTGLGGASGSDWMDIFGRAMQMANKPEVSEAPEAPGQVRNPFNGEMVDARQMEAFVEGSKPKARMPFQEVVNLFKTTFHQESLSVILDIKSTDATPVILAMLIGELNRRGVHIAHIGTWTHSQLEGLGEVKQTVGGKAVGAPGAIKYYEGIGNIQVACARGELKKGDGAQFNAGSILESAGWDSARMTADEGAIQGIITSLRAFKAKYEFRLGLYVQEDDTDERAARKIMEISNTHKDVFDLGFGWGGIGHEGTVQGGGSGMGAQAGNPRTKHWDPGITPATVGGPSEAGQIAEGVKAKASRAYVDATKKALDFVVKYW